MLNEQRVSLAKHRLEKAKETYSTATENFSNAKYMDANNRAYYCIFHSMRAVLALDGVDFRKHSGVISYFRENYIKTYVFDAMYSNIIGKAGIIRSKSDYEDFYFATESEAKEQIDSALTFYEAVAEYVNKQIKPV